ncbi:hypothetical protein HBI95_179920 [Parastagonospora nodorum]|nr:hypothetical protein HBI95_179920 [Parastagonospora nodorum]
MISSNSILQINVREGYRITTLEVIKLIEDLISYLAVAKYTQLQNAQISKVFYKAARQSLSVVSNRSTALITNKFSVALLTKLAILNDANVTLVDAVHYSQKLEENYFKVIDALIITLIKDDDDLLGTVNSYIKPPLKRCKTKAADSRYAKVSRERTKKDKDLEDSNTSSNVLRLRRRDRAAAYSDDYCLDSSLDINSKDNLEDEKATIAKNLLTDAYILYFKELLSNNSRIFANAIGIGKTRAIVLAIEVQNVRAEGNAIEHNAVNDDNKLYPTKGERTFYCACKRSLSFNIISEANMPAVYSKAMKHYLALSAAQFIIVCSFRKVDKHVFRAYNTISVIAQRTIIRKSSSYIEKRAILLPRAAVAQRFILKRILKTRNLWGKLISNFLSIVQNAKQQCRDILEKEGLNKSEASRRVIFNCFKMQAIFKIYSSYKVKRFTLNSVKDLFTNLSKDYFLVREARAITKSSLKEKFSNESVLVMQRGITQHEINLKLIIVALIAFAEAITLTEATHVVIIEPQDKQNTQDQFIIVYFNLDSKLELKVLGKQDVKTTS